MDLSVSAARRWSLMEQTQFGWKRAAAIRGSRANGAFHRTISGLLFNLVDRWNEVGGVRQSGGRRPIASGSLRGVDDPRIRSTIFPSLLDARE